MRGSSRDSAGTAPRADAAGRHGFGRPFAARATVAGRRLARLCLLLLAAWPMLTAADQPVELRVQLKWLHQFQFAGYYAALERGYFRDAGLDVTLMEGGPTVDPTDAVLAGDAEFGVGTSGLLVSRSQGRPVVAVAAVFQHSPYILITRDTPDIVKPADLAGRRVMVEPYAEELIAYLHGAGLRLDDIVVLGHTADPLVLGDGAVDGMTAYTSTEPFLLDRAGIPYRVFDPKVAGIDFYGDTLFTSERFAAEHETTVTAFRDALLRGWRYALRNRDEVIDLIIERYAPDASYERLRFEADDIRRLLIPDLIEVGYMNPDRWAQIAERFEQAGLMDAPVNLDEFLFSPTPPRDWGWTYPALLAASLLTLLVSLAASRFYVLNRRLQAEVATRRNLERQLQQLVITDPGTGLLNRRGFMRHAHDAIAAAGTRPGALALLVVDLDQFKAINDTHGHAAGDHVLTEVARVCRDTVRDTDAVARMGGEEFALLLPDTDEETAYEIAERLRSSTGARAITLPRGDTLHVTASIGLATHQPGESLDALVSRADGAMYEAKALGRNRIVVAAAFNQTARLRMRREDVAADRAG